MVPKSSVDVLVCCKNVPIMMPRPCVDVQVCCNLLQKCFPLNLNHIVENAHVYQGVCKNWHVMSTEEAPNILQIRTIWELLCALAFETLAFIRMFGALALRVGRA